MRNNTQNNASENNSNANKIGKIVNQNQKILIKIPIDPLNPLDLVVPVQINGYKWLIKRGTTVSLPLACVKVLEESGYLS